MKLKPSKRLKICQLIPPKLYGFSNLEDKFKMKQFISILFLFFSFSYYCQFSDSINWRVSYRLQWVDFKASPDKKSKHAAATGASIYYEVRPWNNLMIAYLKVYFQRERSWVKDYGKTDYVLAHEIGHFDLWEVYGRKIRKTLSETTFTKKSWQRDSEKIIKKITKEGGKEQAKYDKQTKHSLIEIKQLEWLKKIAEDLKALEAYQSTEVTLKIK